MIFIAEYKKYIRNSQIETIDYVTSHLEGYEGYIMLHMNVFQ